jgi:perosamine synthetase
MKFIPISKPSITEKEVNYVNDALSSGWVSSLGEYIEKFENQFATFCEVKRAVSVTSATTGLHLAMKAMGVGPGDEVIIPDLTFIATANAVTYTGAKVITVDIEEDSLCICPKAIRKALTNKTKAIIAVHLNGYPANMKLINQIADQYKLYVIEDAAEAHGAKFFNKKVGSLGHVGVFSFYGNKIMTTGEGGMITTNDIDLSERIKFLRDHAMSKSKRYWHNEIGYNYRLTNIQAALGVAQLERIDELLNKRISIYERYYKNFSKINIFQLNRTSKFRNVSFWSICLEIQNFNRKKRDALIIGLKEKNIDSRPYFYPISDMPMYEISNTKIAHKIYQKGIYLPIFHDLKNSEIDYICETIIKLTKKIS